MLPARVLSLLACCRNRSASSSQQKAAVCFIGEPGGPSVQKEIWAVATVRVCCFRLIHVPPLLPLAEANRCCRVLLSVSPPFVLWCLVDLLNTSKKTVKSSN